MTAEEKVRVLIVDDIAETRENIRKLLQFEADIEVVGAARSGQEGIQLATEAQPDVVLMDINMPDIDGITATETIRKKLPFTQIVILSVQSDPNYLRRAMQAGASDFLTKPPDVDELTKSIRRAGRQAKADRTKSPAVAAQSGMPGTSSLRFSSPMLGNVVSVYSPKGGTGSTTVTANLAIALHNDETQAVVVDGNLQFGDLSFFFNQQSKNNVVDLALRGEELDNEVVNDVLITHADSGIKILAAPPRPENAEEISGQQFGAVLQFLRRMFSYILVDANSVLNEVTLAALDQSDLIVLVTTQDIPSIKNARLFLDLANALGIQRQQILLVMNRFDKRRNITPERVSDITKQEVVAVIPMEERLVVPAMDRGVPFLMQNKTSPVSRGIYDLAEHLRERVAKLEQAQAEPA